MKKRCLLLSLCLSLLLLAGCGNPFVREWSGAVTADSGTAWRLAATSPHSGPLAVSTTT